MHEDMPEETPYVHLPDEALKAQIARDRAIAAFVRTLAEIAKEILPGIRDAVAAQRRGK